MRAPLRRRKKLIICVRPGVRLAYARRVCLASALIALDLPEFDRPANAISGAPSLGSCHAAAAPVSNVAPISGVGARGAPAAPEAPAALAKAADSDTIGR